MYKYILLFVAIVCCAPTGASAVRGPRSQPTIQVDKIDQINVLKRIIMINQIEYEVTGMTSIKGPSGQKVKLGVLTNGTKIRYGFEIGNDAGEPLKMTEITIVVD